MKEFIEISRYAGMREDLAQAGGGNSSVKLDEKRMLIKASGIQLADVSEEQGYSIVNYREILEYLNALIKGEAVCPEAEILEKAKEEGGRPSIETFLHAVTGRLTLHTHMLSANILMAGAGGIEKLREAFPDALFVGYATPGACLARCYYQAYLAEIQKKDSGLPLIFLKNHGVVISGGTAKEVIGLSEKVNGTISRLAGLDLSGYARASEIYRAFCRQGMDDKIIVKAENGKVLEAFRTRGFHLWDYQVCPDCIVYCGMAAFEYCKDSFHGDLGRFMQQNADPVLITCGSDLFIRAKSVKKAREIESVLAFSAQIAMYNRNGSLDLLSENERRFLLGWDAEKYRQSVR